MDIERLASSTLALVCSGTGDRAGVYFWRPPIFILKPKAGTTPRERLVTMTNESAGANHKRAGRPAALQVALASGSTTLS